MTHAPSRLSARSKLAGAGTARPAATQPVPREEMADLRKRCAMYSGDGHLELYKSSIRYDAEVGREQHGYPSPQEVPL